LLQETSASLQAALRAVALCTALAACSDDDATPEPEPFDPNWTDFDASVDLIPDAEPPSKQHVWADWTAATVGAQGSAQATFPGVLDGGLTLTYSGDLHNAQIDGGLPYWMPGTAYTSLAVPNPPVTTDNIMLAGGMGSVHTLTFSAPIKDPVLAVMSLGSAETTTVCQFDTPFELLSHGPSYYPEGQPLKHLPDNKLSGRESSGAIRFSGTFTTIRWTALIAEPWYGLTVGLPTPQ
jgi:hypothetical protein